MLSTAAGSDMFATTHPGSRPEMFPLPVHQQAGGVQQLLVWLQPLLPPPTMRVRRSAGGSGQGGHQGSLRPGLSSQDPQAQLLWVCLAAQDRLPKTRQDADRQREVHPGPEDSKRRIQTGCTVSNIILDIKMFDLFSIINCIKSGRNLNAVNLFTVLNRPLKITRMTKQAAMYNVTDDCHSKDRRDILNPSWNMLTV